MPNLPEYAIAFHGAASAGGSCTTVNPLYTANELAHQLEDSGAEAAADGAAVPRRRPARRPSGPASTRCSWSARPRARRRSPSCSATRPTRPEVEIDPAADLAVLPYSSGTTGLPKGVMLTHRNLVANLCQVQAAFPIEPDDTLIGVLPFFHIYGMTVIMNQGLRAGATIVTMPRFDLEQFLDLLESHGVTARLRGPADRAGARQAPRRRRPRPLGAADDHVRRRARSAPSSPSRSRSGSTAT